MIAAVAKTKKERDLIFKFLEERQKNNLMLKLKSFSLSPSSYNDKPLKRKNSSNKLSKSIKKNFMSTFNYKI